MADLLWIVGAHRGALSANSVSFKWRQRRQAALPPYVWPAVTRTRILLQHAVVFEQRSLHFACTHPATLGYVVTLIANASLIPAIASRDAHPEVQRLGGKLDTGEDVVACMARRSARKLVRVRQRASARHHFLARVRQTRRSWFGLSSHRRLARPAKLQTLEGDLEWIDVGRILDLPLWEGDRHFSPGLQPRPPPVPRRHAIATAGR